MEGEDKRKERWNFELLLRNSLYANVLHTVFAHALSHITTIEVNDAEIKI